MCAEVLRDSNRRVQVIQRPVGDSQILFQGPLGLWPWPFVNLVLAVVNKLSGGGGRQDMRSLFPETATRRIEYIRDGTGRIIEKLEEITLG